MSQARNYRTHAFKSDVLLQKGGSITLTPSHKRSLTFTSNVFDTLSVASEPAQQNWSYASEQYHKPSTALNATLEQAALSQNPSPSKHLGQRAPRAKRSDPPAGAPCAHGKAVSQKSHIRRKDTKFFKPKIMVQQRYNPHAPQDGKTQDIFGDHIPPPRFNRVASADFIPKYDKPPTAADRKAQEIYGCVSRSCERITRPFSAQVDRSIDDSKYRKMQNLNSAIFGDYNKIGNALTSVLAAKKDLQRNAEKPQKPDNKDRAVNHKDETFNRQISSVLPIEDRQKPSKAPAFTDGWENNRRAADHMYSDIFSDSYSRNVQQNEKRNYSRPQVTLGSIEGTQKEDTTHLDARGRKFAMLQNAMQRSASAPNYRDTQKWRYQVPKPDENRAPASPKVATMNMSNIDANCSMDDIRNCSMNAHIVDLSMDTNNFTGNCTGTGEITVRYQDPKMLESLQMNLLDKGIKIDSEKPNVNRKDTYYGSSRVNMLNAIQRQKKGQPVYVGSEARDRELASFGAVTEPTKFRGPGVKSARQSAEGDKKERYALEGWKELNKKFNKPPFRSKYTPVLMLRPK